MALDFKLLRCSGAAALHGKGLFVLRLVTLSPSTMREGGSKASCQRFYVSQTLRITHHQGDARLHGPIICLMFIPKM